MIVSIMAAPNREDWTEIVEVTRPAVASKADAISGINTVLGLIGVDIYTGKPHPSVLGYSTYGGNCSPAVRPIGLRIISKGKSFSGYVSVRDWWY